MIKPVYHDVVSWTVKEPTDRELIVIDKFGDRISIEYNKPIYHDIVLDTKIYETFDVIKKSALWKLPIEIKLGINLEKRDITQVYLNYE